MAQARVEVHRLYELDARLRQNTFERLVVEPSDTEVKVEGPSNVALEVARLSSLQPLAVGNLGAFASVTSLTSHAVAVLLLVVRSPHSNHLHCHLLGAVRPSQAFPDSCKFLREADCILIA